MPPLSRVLPWFPLFAVLLLPASASAQRGKARTYLFCFWNVENLFDDKPNPNLEGVDREFDRWFAKDKDALRVKLERICEVLLGKEMNAGRGPDVIALAEVESLHAAELVRDALNKRLRDKDLHYRAVVYRDPRGGRSIATAVVTRLKVVESKTRLLGRLQRILKVHIEENRHDLVVVASHWSSRVSDKTGRGRAHYGDVIYNDFRAAYKGNPRVDYLVCGDFNDTPDDRSVTDHLHATGDLKRVLGLGKGDPPLFYNPFADLAKKNKGTHYFGARAYVFDNVCLSPGLLDGEGWSYVNRSARIVEKLSFRGRPDRFGGPRDRRPWKNRGASDHYPVTVELRVSAGK
jgi:endonuclease/exonuclease/phosphatase family metal-dependent hydrolase